MPNPYRCSSITVCSESILLAIGMGIVMQNVDIISSSNS